jgi:hypothetical protein
MSQAAIEVDHIARKVVANEIARSYYCTSHGPLYEPGSRNDYTVWTKIGCTYFTLYKSKSGRPWWSERRPHTVRTVRRIGRLGSTNLAHSLA